ncbi:MAG: phosphatidylglycerophosphatase A [Thermodesulfobacteriota bacterium]|nr:phosphatidylglycerophosphatase A [Thermodesulfobacteriota bacterium]
MTGPHREPKKALHRIRERSVVFLATGAYVGRIPVASGTFGTLVALPLCFLLSLLSPVQGVLFIVLFVGCAVWIAGEAEKIFEQKDSRLIVIDEVAGFLVTLFLIPWSTETVIGGFLLFRVMDIAKPFPIRKLETGLPGGWGVVGDDVLAGVYANVLLRVVMPFF